MENVDDDFGELYADVEIQATSAINTAPKSPQLYINSSNQHKTNHVDRHYTSDDSSEEQQHLRNNDAKLGEDDRRRVKSSGTVNVENAVVGDEIESESEEEDDEDDFVLVVNDEDFEAKTGGVEGKRGGEEAVEVERGGAEANLARNGVDHSGSNCGGEVKGNAAKFTGGNSQYKYVRRNGAVSMVNQRIGISRRVDREDTGCFQPGRSSGGSFEPTYAGSAVLGFGDQGNGFWLPRYRTIVDVDIDNFEQKPWTHTGADATDYFNFGFDEDSWRNYCQSLDQLRQQTIQMRNQGCGNSRSNLVGGGATKLLEPKEVSEWESCLATRQFNRQIGQAIRVEDSNTERQPSMDIKPPRNFDSDVVIEITLQEQEEPSDSLKEPDYEQQRQSLSPEIPKTEEPEDDLEAKLEISEEGCEEGKVVRETQMSGDLKSDELRKLSAEDSIHSPATSSDIRSHESASVSSSMHESSSIQKEGPNFESDAQSSGKMDIFSGGNQRPPKILKDDASSDRDSTDANPCVAGIDLLSDDHIESTTTSSYSHSERLNNVDHCDLKKSRSFQSSSPDSVMDRSQVARDTYHFSRVSERDDTNRKGSRHTHSPRLRSPIEEGRKLSQRNFLRHSETKSDHRNNYDHHNDLPKHIRVDGYSSLNYRDEYWRHSSHFIEDWPSHQEKDYSRSSYDRNYVENQFYAEFRKDLYPQKHWDLLEDEGLNTQRRCDEDRIYSERTQRMRDDMGHRDQLLEERGFVFRKEKPPFQNQPHSIPKYHSSTDMDRHSQYREIHDDQLNKRSRHDTPVDYRYSDYPIIDRYAHSPLHGRHLDYLDSELEHQGRLRHSRRELGTSFREDEFFDHPSSDLHYPPFIKENNEYQKRQIFPSIRDYQDEESVYAERRHHSTLSRNDADVHLLCPRYERSSRYASAKNSRDFGQHYDNRDAFDREDSGIYCHQDDYFENRRNVFLSESMDLQEDVILQSNFNNAVSDEMLDSVKGIPRNKWRGAKHGCVSGKIRMHAHDMKNRYGVMCAGGKFSDRTSTALMTAKDERTGLCRNPVKVHHVRETESSGNVSTSGSAPKNDAHLHADQSFQKLKKQQEVAASCPETAVNKAQKVEASQSVSTSHCNDSDLEEGQIPTEEPSTKIVKASKYVPGGLAEKDNVKGRLRRGQELVNQNDSRVYDESRILATMAKMEKRRERFKGPILEKKGSDSAPKPQVVEIVETPKSTGQRPSRKRQWGGS